MRKNKPFVFELLAVVLAALMLTAPLTPAHAATEGTIELKIDVTETATTDLTRGSATYALRDRWVRSFSNGSGSGQASKIFIDSVTLAGSGTQSYDLDGTLTGPIGSVTFSRIYGIFIHRTNAYVASTQDENVTIGGDFIVTKYLIANGDTLANVAVSLGPNGVFHTTFPGPTGIAVTATTGDALTLTNASSADSVTCEVVIIGS